jgi:hypothetical protein
VPEIDTSALPELLSASSIDGVRFVAAATLGASDPKLSRIIDEAVYVAALPRAALDTLGVRDAGELQQRIALAAQGPLAVRREIDGIGKRVDVAQYLLGARAGVGAEALRRAGLVGELMPLELRLRITGSGTAKPSEALQALLGQPELPVRFVRAALLCSRHGVHVSPLELEQLRAAFAQAREQPAALEHAGQLDAG